MKTLESAPFNKVRMCVFLKYYSNVENEPEFYPYLKKESQKGADGKIKFVWDLSRFDPAFFQHLEKRIDNLKELGIEADIILFHPYDKGHWGFDSLGKENDLKYIKYLTARLSSFRNVWWSMANEFDYIKTKPREIWDVYTKAVVNADPYNIFVRFIMAAFITTTGNRNLHMSVFRTDQLWKILVGLFCFGTFF